MQRPPRSGASAGAEKNGPLDLCVEDKEEKDDSIMISGRRRRSHHHHHPPPPPKEAVNLG